MLSCKVDTTNGTLASHDGTVLLPLALPLLVMCPVRDLMVATSPRSSLGMPPRLPAHGANMTSNLHECIPTVHQSIPHLGFLNIGDDIAEAIPCYRCGIVNLGME